MHGNSLIDIVKKRSISGGLSPIEEDQQQQRLNDPRSPIDDEWFQQPPDKEVDGMD